MGGAMSKKGVRITLLVEDRLLERFIRQVLLTFGFHRRELRVLPYPVGQGSAKLWVDRQYPREVRAYRSKATYQQIAMLVGTDADEQTHQQRLQRLESALQAEGADARTQDERIVVWIPKWHIETWIAHFSSLEVVEHERCKHRIAKSNVPACAKAFVDEYRAFADGQTIETLASLYAAYHETTRLQL
jgi:hypothetical protein